ncbi:MAG: leucine-rich repeat protein [Eubacteriales bacterium]|nr:leucine-rich repeat protein [Eubacteriales bacterium]
MQYKSVLKKMLSIVLSILMVVSVCPVTAFAYEGVTFTALDGTAGASSAGGTENCDKLIDGSVDTKWCVTNFSSAYIVIEASSAIKVSGYQMSTGDDTATETSRNPKDWTLYGCNDYNTKTKTGTWDVIHKVIGDTVLKNTNKTTYSFACDMTDAEYKYFKLEITKNSGSVKCMQLSEFVLTDCEHNTTVVSTGEADCTNYGYVEKSCSVCSLTYKMITEDAKGHTWAEESKTPATCTQTGKINQKCSVCDATQTVNDPGAPALGHTWTEVDRKPATCAANEKINQKCSVCNITRSIDNSDVTALGHKYVDGYCTRCLNADSTPVKPNGDGTVESPYEISSAGELYWFAGLVNGTLTDGTAKNTSANAKLTADITVNRNVLKADGSVADETSDFVAWKPIGYNPSSRDDNKAYKGTFDGQGHTISGLFYKASEYYAGLFGYCLYSNISNVCLSDSYIQGGRSIAGICGFLEAGYITNCKNSATVKGGEWTGGICGAEACNTNNYDQGKECVIANCYNDGLVISEYSTSGSIIGLLDRARAYNCYNNSDACSLKAGYINSSSSADKFMNKTAEEIATGKVAYLLSQGYKVGEKVYDGSIWGQKIGTQTSPVLNGDRVYDNSVYPGCIGAPGEPLEVKYENVEGTPIYADHNYVFTKIVEPTCYAKGCDLYTCTICNTTENRNETNMVDHEVVTTYSKDKTIEHHRCKNFAFVVEETENLPESEHNYKSNTNEDYELSYPGADTISITFDDQFKTESNYDYLRVYDKNGNQLAKYEGTAAAGKTYTFDCDYIKIYFHSDSSTEYYGFKITKVVAVKAGCGYAEPDTEHTHSYGDYVSDGNATCTENGTESAKCACGEFVSRTEENSALGHSFGENNATCAVCGIANPNYVVPIKATVTADSPTAFVDENVSISDEGGYLFYKATAQKDGVFTFYTTGDGDIDTYGSLFSSRNINTENPISSDDDGGEDLNCRIDYCASEGETVYFAVSYVDPTKVDEQFNVHIDFNEAYVDNGVVYLKDTDADTKNDIYYVQGCKFDTPTDVTILSKINGIPVTYIAESVFEDCEYLTSVTIPGSVKTIDKDAFSNCINLKTVTLGEGVDYIDYSAFSGTAIESITIPGSVKTIYEEAFCDCRNLKTIILNEGIENIHDWAFGNTAVESVTIPASVKYFNGSVFACCYDLKSISIADANESYKSVDNIVCSKDGTALIYTLPSLTETLVVPEGVKSIGFDAFYASLISGVKLSSTVEYIGRYAFEYCKNLSSVELNEGLKTIDEYAFEYCDKLFSVKLPSTLETIGDRAFYGCGIYYVDVPASVTKIGSNAFSDSNVETIIINNKDTTLPSYFVYDSATIYGHTGSTAETYANNRGNTFVSIDLEEGVECTHSFVNDEIITAPTCTSKGLAKTKCAICGAQGEDAEIEMTEHKDPVGVCVECGHKEPFVSDVELNQSITCTFSETSQLSTACFTATQDGTYTATISDMNGISIFAVASNTARDDFYFEPGKETMVYELKAGEQIFITAMVYGPASDASFKATVTCNHTNVKTSDAVKPTCFSVGWTEGYKCLCCDHEVRQEEVAKLPHTYNSGVVTKAPTCTSTGVKTYTCKVCKVTKTESIPKLAHTYKTYTTRATTSAAGKIVTKCSVCGTVKSTQTIARISSVKLSGTSYIYNGKTKTPTVTVKDRTGKKLVKNTDYTVSYAKGRKYVGKYKVTVRFRGKYSGTKTLYFTIKPKSTSISSLKAGSKKFTVKWYKRTTQTTGYQVQYSTSRKFSSPKTVTISKTGTTSKTVSKLRAKKRYYVRVRTYKTVKINGKATKIYSSWSKAKSVTTKS